jgi:predicted dehydrogenase
MNWPRLAWPEFNRRNFLIGAGAAVAAVCGLRYWRTPVRLAMIGAGTQGNNLATGLWRSGAWGGPTGTFVAVCDVDREHAEKFKARWAPDAEIYGKHEEVLERDDVEAVLVATPDHWHARIIRDALSAGKAVYGEKPLGLTVAEGQLLVRAVEKTGGVFQGGTFQRSLYEFQTAACLVRDGALGELLSVDIQLPIRWKGDVAGPFKPKPVPAHLDWERWLGQAPLVPYVPERCHGLFRRWYEYAGGSVADWGVHYLDILDLAVPSFASSGYTVQASAELPKAVGGFNTPTAFEATLVGSDGLKVTVGPQDGPGVGSIRFDGERGWVAASRGKLWGPAVRTLRGWGDYAATNYYGMGGTSMNGFMHHLCDFFSAMQGGSTPRSDIHSMHRVATMCHLINLSIRTGGRRLTWEAEREVVDDGQARAMLSRAQRTPYEIRPA